MWHLYIVCIKVQGPTTPYVQTTYTGRHGISALYLENYVNKLFKSMLCCYICMGGEGILWLLGLREMKTHYYVHWKCHWIPRNVIGHFISRVSRPQFCWDLAILCDPPFFSGYIEFGGVVVKFYSSVEITLYLLADFLLQYVTLFQSRDII